MSEWTPVSENRPGPEEDGFYFVSYENRNFEEQYVTIAFYEPIGRWSSDFFIIGDIVTAWMPLPEPYKETEQ